MICFIFTILLNIYTFVQWIYMYFRHWLFHKEQRALWTKYTVHNFGMDNPNLLNCLILTRNTLTLFSSLLPSLSSPIFLSSSPSSIFRPLYLLYISLSYSIPLSFFFPLSSSILLFSSLYSPPSHPSPSNILPFLYFASLLFSLLQAFSLIPVSSSPSLLFPRSFFPSLSSFIPLQFPSLSMLFYYTYNNVV